MPSALRNGNQVKTIDFHSLWEIEMKKSKVTEIQIQAILGRVKCSYP